MNSEFGEEDPQAVKDEEQDQALSEPGQAIKRSNGPFAAVIRLSDFVVEIATNSGDEPTSYA